MNTCDECGIEYDPDFGGVSIEEYSFRMDQYYHNMGFEEEDLEPHHDKSFCDNECELNHLRK